MRGKMLLLAIMLVGLVSAVVIESGDAGEQFAKDKADEMCREPGVDGVHICLGNTVRVVWSDESKGVTFYEPEGNIVNCPPVPPSQMGGECVQLMHPNYCPEESVCGDIEPVEFPGGTEGEIIYNGSPVEEEEEVITTPADVVEEEPETEEGTGEIVVPFGGGTTTTAGTEGEAYDWLVIIVVVLALVALVLLYLAFRRTTMH